MQDQFNASWQCAKELGVSRELALPLASLSQPWLPTLRPCRFSAFLQGMRDLSLSTYDDSKYEAGDAAEWRVEIRIPDAAEAVLAAGAWFLHKQVGRVGATTGQHVAPKKKGLKRGKAPVLVSPAMVDAVDESSLPADDACSGEHLRYTPWALPVLPLHARVRVDTTGGCSASSAMQRSESVSVVRRSISIVITCKGCTQNLSQDGGVLPSQLLRRLSLTNPQVS